MTDKYERKKNIFKFSHDKEDIPDDLRESRYVLCEDGIYRNPSSNNTNFATLMFTGDLLCQTRQQLRHKDALGHFDFDDEFKYVKKYFYSADLVVGNLEATISQSASYMFEEKFKEHKPHLNAPASFLGSIKNAGFDVLVNANNHCCDSGLKGIYETIDNMNDYGLIHTGTFTNETDNRFIIIDVNGIKIGILSYATYFNLKDLNFTNEGVSTFLNKYSYNLVKRDVANARKAGAEYIIVYIHWGNEFKTHINYRQKIISKQLSNSGVDFIIGSHPHILQEFKYLYNIHFKKIPIVYSMGNFLSHMYKLDEIRDSIILNISLEKINGKVRVNNISYIPCRCMLKYRGSRYVPVPITSDLKNKNSSISNDFNRSYTREKNVLGKLINPIL